MSLNYNGELLKDKKKGDVLGNIIPEGEMIVSEGPKGNPLWKNKNTLNEKNGEKGILNE